MSEASREERPLLLIHGMSCGPTTWAPIVPLLSSSRSVIVVNLPGHRGGPPLVDAGRIRSSEYVDAVEAEMDRLGIETADIVGNSLGGWIGLQLGGRGRATSVVCLAPAGGWRIGSLFDRWITVQFALAYRFARVLAHGTWWRTERLRAARLLLAGMVVKPSQVSDGQLEELVEDIAECTALRAAIRRPEGRDLGDVPRVECPVLIAWSEKDRILISRRARRRLERQVGAPDVIELRGVGHVPMSDDPALVAATVLDFTNAVGVAGTQVQDLAI